MPRIARAVAVGIPHHITQRGNYRQVVFEEESDYRQLSGVAEVLQRQIFAEDMGILPDEQPETKTLSKRLKELSADG